MGDGRILLSGEADEESFDRDSGLANVVNEFKKRNTETAVVSAMGPTIALLKKLGLTNAHVATLAKLAGDTLSSKAGRVGKALNVANTGLPVDRHLLLVLVVTCQLTEMSSLPQSAVIELSGIGMAALEVFDIDLSLPLSTPSRIFCFY